ncbi:MAG: energy transducer TonB [Ignavibacteriales bacterium]|nr:energy transducer TonB [Ignavibacteriales bacterium]
MENLNKIFIILLLSSLIIFAQNEIDKMPEIKGGIQVLVKNIKYPESAKQEGIEGKVFVKANVDEAGNVESAEVVKSINKELDEAAISAIKLTKFIPGEKNGKFVIAEVVIPIHFKLDDKKEKK